MTRKQRRKLSSISRKRLAAYSAVIGSVCAVPHLCPADVVQYTPPGGPVSIDTNQTFDVDFNGDATNDFQLLFSFDSYLFFINSLANLVDTTGQSANVIPAGGAVGPDITGWTVSGDFNAFSNIRGFVGVQFDIPGGSPHFGYLDIRIDEESEVQSLLTLYGGAYESNPNTPLNTVPEPSSIAALAFGAMAMSLRRRKSKKA